MGSGNAGYNVSKSAVKTFTEQRTSPHSRLTRSWYRAVQEADEIVAHELRNVSDVCSAHLFVYVSVPTH